MPVEHDGDIGGRYDVGHQVRRVARHALEMLDSFGRVSLRDSQPW